MIIGCYRSITRLRYAFISRLNKLCRSCISRSKQMPHSLSSDVVVLERILDIGNDIELHLKNLIIYIRVTHVSQENQVEIFLVSWVPLSFGSISTYIFLRLDK